MRRGVVVGPEAGRVAARGDGVGQADVLALDGLPVLVLLLTHEERVDRLPRLEDLDLGPDAACHVADQDLACADGVRVDAQEDRKSTRLNSSHSQISYAVFCLKQK